MSYARNFYIYSEYISGSLGFLLNLLLIFLICHTKNATLKKYNRILLQAVFIDLSYTVVNFIIKPVRAFVRNSYKHILQIIVPYHPVLIFTINIVFATNKLWSFLLTNIVMCTTMYSVAAIPILFYFRYRILCLGRDFSIKRQLACLFISGTSSMVLFVIHWYAYFHMTEETVEFAKKSVKCFDDDQGENRVVIVYNAVRFLALFYILIIIESFLEIKKRNHFNCLPLKLILSCIYIILITFSLNTTCTF